MGYPTCRRGVSDETGITAGSHTSSMTDMQYAALRVTDRRMLRHGTGGHTASNGGHLPDRSFSSGPGVPGATAGDRQGRTFRRRPEGCPITPRKETADETQSPHPGRTGSRQGVVQVQPGLHDPRFLPFGDVGIDRSESAGKRHQLASMNSGVFRRARTHRARLQAATGPNDPEDVQRGRPNIFEGE